MKMKTLADFQICISVPLTNHFTTISESYKETVSLILFSFFSFISRRFFSEWWF